jgi:hypothetical protein
MFAIEWGTYQYIVMPFGLKNAPSIFSRVVVEAFKDFLHKFLEAYFDNWTIFSLLKNHIECLRLMLDKCKQCQIYLNLKKCIFPFGVLLGHIVCKQGLLVDRSKIAIIVDLPPPPPPLLQLNSYALHWDILDTTRSLLRDMHRLQHLKGRFLELAFVGPPYTEMLKNTTEPMMYAKEFGNLPKEMKIH